MRPVDSTWLDAESHRLLDGAAGAADPRGGFCWLAEDGSADRARGRPLWITARMTHLFSLGALLGRPADAGLADHGVAALTGPFEDAEHGGWFPELGDDGPSR